MPLGQSSRWHWAPRATPRLGDVPEGQDQEGGLSGTRRGETRQNRGTRPQRRHQARGDATSQGDPPVLPSPLPPALCAQTLGSRANLTAGSFQIPAQLRAAALPSSGATGPAPEVHFRLPCSVGRTILADGGGGGGVAKFVVAKFAREARPAYSLWRPQSEHARYGLS